MSHTRAQHHSLRRALLLVGMLAVLASSGLLLSMRQWPSQPGTTQHATTVVPPAPKVTPTQQRQILEAYGKLPLRFEANAGQTDSQVQFLVRGSGSTLFLTATEAVLAVHGPEGTSPVRMQLVGANPTPHVRGEDALPGTSNYFLGNDPQQWRTAVPSYAKVVYDEIYPGVDLVYYGRQGRVEHDFIVTPGISPSVIAFDVHGADQVAIDAEGDLVVTTRDGDVRLQKPVLYQDIEGQRQDIPGGYMLTAEQRVGFQVGAYDATRPLVIDPVLVYATYLGGSRDDRGNGIAVDAAGQVYVTGWAGPLNFPVTGNALQTQFGGGVDAFVAKLNPAGSALGYATYLGGNGGDIGRSIAVDAAGNTYVTGETTSSNFPGAAASLIQDQFGGGVDAFVAKLNAAGSALVYATYLGGSESDFGFGLAVDAAGQAYVTGYTNSSDFPVVGSSPFQADYGGSIDAFVAKVNPTGSALVYATYLGGSTYDEGFSLTVDAAGQAYVTGFTAGDFPVAGSPFQADYGGGNLDAFVTKLNAAGTALVYATYLGGIGDDIGLGIIVDAAGQAYVTGQTDSLNFPLAGSPFQTTIGGGTYDTFVAKVNAACTMLVYSTYLGGSGFDWGNGIAVDAAGNAYVTGETTSSNFPVTGSPFQAQSGGGVDAFVAKIGTDTVPPAITITATPTTLWPPNRKLVLVTVSGTITDAASDVDPTATTYAVTDEYGLVQPSGPITVEQKPDGSYGFTIDIALQASRNDTDTNGRKYTITVRAFDNADNEGSATAFVTVPHDQGQGWSLASR